MLLRSHPDSTRPHESSKTMQNLKLSLSQTAWAKNVWSHTNWNAGNHTHKLKCRYVTPASQSHISHECSPLRWAISCKHEIAPLLDIGCLNGNGEEVWQIIRTWKNQTYQAVTSKLSGRSFTSLQMFHTLAQKQQCEFCCGMHLTCTKQSLKNCQENLLIQREFQYEVNFLRPCSEEGSEAVFSIIKIVE